MRVARLAVLPVAALALLAGACSDDGPAAGEARLEVDGIAIVERSGGGRDEVTGSTTVRRGDRVSMSDGLARLQFAEGVRMELREGVGDADASVLVIDDVPTLEAGDLLVTTPGSTHITAAGTSVSVEAGAAKVRRALGMGVVAYDAAVSLDSAGQERAVPALRQMHVPALGRPPQSPRPLDYDEADAWDRRFLGDVIELDRRLEPISYSYTRNVATGAAVSATFVRTVLAGLADEPALDDGLLAGNSPRDPGETLVGAAIADLSGKGSFAERWAAVFGFRDEGATWGLVARDQAVRSGPLLDVLEDAITASPLEFASAPTSPADDAPPPPPAGSEEPRPDGGTNPPSSGGSTPPPTTTVPPPPPAFPPPPTTPEPPETIAPIVEPADPVVDLLTGIVEGIVGGLLGG